MLFKCYLEEVGIVLHLEVEEKKSRKLLEAILAGLLLVVDPHLWLG